MNSFLALLQRVLDDDDRTRRANLLLLHIGLWLVIIAVALLGVAAISIPAMGWVPLVGGVGAVTAIGALRQRLRSHRHGNYNGSKMLD
jgi:hypothetical protein